MSTPAVLPSQAAVMSDIDRLKQKMLEPASQEVAEAAMAAAIKDPEFGVEQKLLEQVQALGDSAKRVDATFASVSTQLGSIDNNNYTDQNGKPVKKLKPIWDGFHQRFKRYLWTSRDTATDTATYILSFYKVILPSIDQTLKDASQPGVSYADKKEMINDIRADLKRFIERKNPSTQTSPRPVPQGADPYTVAQAHSQDFLDLKAEIEAFKGTFNTFAAGTESTLNAELTTVTNKINSLTVEIQGYDTVVKAMGIAMGATAVAGGAAAAVAFFCGPWGPMISLGILITGALALIAELGTLIAYLKKKSDAEDELNTANARKTALEKELATLQAVKSKLQTQTTDITYICQRLDQFANIWAMVASNAREVDGLLATAAEPTTSLTTISGNIAVLKSGYGALYNGLKAYATNVAGSGVAKPTT